MNQDIAELARWGRPEVYARADTKIELRPSFDLAILAEASEWDVLVAHLARFLQRAEHPPADLHGKRRWPASVWALDD